MEVLPDLGLLRHVFDAAGRRRRITQLEAVVLDNPAAGNYEELADLYLDEGHYARARACYDKAIAGRAGDLDPIYRRAIAEIHLGDHAAAIQDLDTVTSRDPKYGFNRAIALLAHAHAGAGHADQADARPGRKGGLNVALIVALAVALMAAAFFGAKFFMK